jgi:hypothetical protein
LRERAADRRFRCMRCSLRRRFMRSCSVSFGSASSSDTAGVSARRREAARERLRHASATVSHLMFGCGDTPEKLSSEAEDGLDILF